MATHNNPFSQQTPTGLVIAQTVGITASLFLLGESRPPTTMKHIAKARAISAIQYTLDMIQKLTCIFSRLKCQSILRRRPRSNARSRSSSRKSMVHSPHQRRRNRAAARHPQRNSHRLRRLSPFVALLTIPFPTVPLNLTNSLTCLQRTLAQRPSSSTSLLPSSFLASCHLHSPSSYLRITSSSLRKINLRPRRWMIRRWKRALRRTRRCTL